MKVERLAATAEIVSSIAVVIALVYLAVQTQQTNSALVASSRQATMTSDVAMITALVSNPEAWTNTHTPLNNGRERLVVASRVCNDKFPETTNS